MNFSKSLIQWYLQNKRDLPWRNTVDPYFIWLSEIMLQQTRVAQGLPYFLRFTEAFPTVFDLAKATEEEVLKLWQGLGYYSRARNLHKTAQQVAFDYDGVFPESYAELLKLKGIGEYTAAAIASFAYNESVPVVDGNVYRVLSRYFEVETDIASSGAKKEFMQLAAELLPAGEANLFNQAVMEFGALQCVPKNPDCANCIFNNSCAALQKKKVTLLPIKSKKLKVKTRFFNYLVYTDEVNNTLIEKRTQKGIWHNLYEFPLLETEKEVSFEELLDLMSNQDIKNKILEVSRFNTALIVHKLTHQHLNIHFWKITVEGKLSGGTNWESVKKMPFPIVIHNFIEAERF
ncbi:MAG: A/G-specific adenine glycosylase [Flavobacterium sp.]|uniref:A/G-specific adenine glycosylase n=1 Tax=Flavobacterium sp. TaxID=239 RepID=UPI00391DEF00